MDLRSQKMHASKPHATPEVLTVVQFFLHANIDSELSQAGSGDTGGIATLLVSLGDALAGQEHKSPTEPLASSASGNVLPQHRVLTISRGQMNEFLDDAKVLGDDFSGHKYARIPLLQGPVPASQSWPLRIEVRRGLRRILKAAGRIDVMHLRMADVGSFAALEVARELQIPVVFTVAPDPHAVIESMDHSRELTRENFGRIDQLQHFWFRTWLVDHLASHAAHTVYFPRPDLDRDIRKLLGRELSPASESYTVVPEGIDVNMIHRATLEAEEFARGGSGSEPLSELRQLLERLPEKRRGLPLLISVGRFHRIKGMAALVETWAGSDLCMRTNLLLVGGNLDSPSPDEAEQLDRISALVSPAHQDSSGLILSGHRPHGTVARWIAAAKTGIPHYAGASGVYVCASVKEEFGIALLEALAAGLIVVAPNSGGPASYIEQGHTGFLTNTQDPEQLQASIDEALKYVSEESTNQRADEARRVVEASFTIGTMAEKLGRVYAKVKQEHDEPERKLASTP
jgi:glycosyltransferase involved in cell wall biosynthesis